MIAVFAGCRYLDVGRWWWPTLDAIREEHGITEVWHGACSLDHQHPDKLAGVDAGIDLWARDRGLAVRMFPAPWALSVRARWWRRCQEFGLPRCHRQAHRKAMGSTQGSRARAAPAWHGQDDAHAPGGARRLAVRVQGRHRHV